MRKVRRTINDNEIFALCVSFSGGLLTNAATSRWFPAMGFLTELALGLASVYLCIWYFFTSSRRVTAIHEAAHTVGAWFEPSLRTVEYACLHRGGGGAMYYPVAEEREAFERELLADMMVALCGIVAEERCCGKIGYGCSSDLRRCEQDAKEGASMMREHPEALMEDALVRARKVVAARWTEIERLAAELDRRGKLGTSDIAAILGPRPSGY